METIESCSANTKLRALQCFLSGAVTLSGLRPEILGAGSGKKLVSHCCMCPSASLVLAMLWDAFGGWRG